MASSVFTRDYLEGLYLLSSDSQRLRRFKKYIIDTILTARDAANHVDAATQLQAMADLLKAYDWTDIDLQRPNDATIAFPDPTNIYPWVRELWHQTWIYAGRDVLREANQAEMASTLNLILQEVNSRSQDLIDDVAQPGEYSVVFDDFSAESGDINAAAFFDPDITTLDKGSITPDLFIGGVQVGGIYTYTADIGFGSRRYFIIQGGDSTPLVDVGNIEVTLDGITAVMTYGLGSVTTEYIAESVPLYTHLTTEQGIPLPLDITLLNL